MINVYTIEEYLPVEIFLKYAIKYYNPDTCPRFIDVYNIYKSLEIVIHNNQTVWIPMLTNPDNFPSYIDTRGVITDTIYNHISKTLIKHSIELNRKDKWVY